MNISLFFKHKQTIMVITLVFVLLAATFSFLQPVYYGAQSKIIVVQQYPDGADPYTLSQSGSYLSIILAEVIRTNSFYNEVVGGDYNIDKGYFENGGDISLITKNWQRAVSAKTIADTGIVKISIIHPEREQAQNIADGIHGTLIEKHSAFHGNGNLVSIRVIDSPIISKVSPDLKMNFAIAVAAGIATSLLYINAFPQKRHQLKIIGAKGKGSKKHKEIDSHTIMETMKVESK